jgi:hypothetical protein
VSLLEPGELATLAVTFVEDREGRAIVRLPNGSKTTLDYDALRPLGARVDFVRSPRGSEETAWCREDGCAWSGQAPTRTAAEDAFIEHMRTAHPGGRADRV